MPAHPQFRVPRRHLLAAVVTGVAFALTWMGAAHAAWTAATTNSGSTFATAQLSPPTGLTVTRVARTYRLDWTLPGAAGQGNAQDVQRGDSGAAAVTIAGVAQAAITYTDATVVGDTAYCYDVVTKFNNWIAAGASVCNAGSIIPPTQAVNAGGAAAGYYVASAGFNNRCGTITTASAINTAQVPVPAPQAVYQSAVLGPANNGNPACTWTATGLTPNTAYQVRLQLAEIQCATVGCRLSTIDIQGVNVLNNFDILATAGGRYIAIVRTFATTSSATGQIVVTIYGGQAPNGPSLVNGIEIL